MFYKVEFDVDNFEFWSGARDRIEGANEDQKRAVQDRIEEYFEGCGEIPTDTQINDLVWFECDDIFYSDEEEDDEE